MNKNRKLNELFITLKHEMNNKLILFNLIHWSLDKADFDNFSEKF